MSTNKNNIHYFDEAKYVIATWDDQKAVWIPYDFASTEKELKNILENLFSDFVQSQKDYKFETLQEAKKVFLEDYVQVFKPFVLKEEKYSFENIWNEIKEFK